MIIVGPDSKIVLFIFQTRGGGNPGGGVQGARDLPGNHTKRIPWHFGSAYLLSQ